MMVTVKRNDPCPCGSGKKYNKCCMMKDEIGEHKEVKLERFQREKEELQRRMSQYIISRYSFIEYSQLSDISHFTVDEKQGTQMIVLKKNDSIPLTIEVIEKAAPHIAYGRIFEGVLAEEKDGVWKIEHLSHVFPGRAKKYIRI